MLVKPDMFHVRPVSMAPLVASKVSILMTLVIHAKTDILRVHPARMEMIAVLRVNF